MRLSILAGSRLALACSSLAIGCGGTSVAEISEQEVTLTLRTVASAPEVADVGEPAGGYGVSRVFMAARAVRFEACEAGVSDLILAPRGYDLASDPPPSERITTAVSEFCALNIDVEAPEAAPDGIADGVGLYLEAESSGPGIAYSLTTPFSLRFQADPASSFGAQPLLLGFDVSTWLANLSLDPALAETAFEMFETQLHDAAALYVDLNGNGALDDDEREPLVRSEP
jgi:hypothetical protein